jgi:hypothetical protein
MYGAPAVSPYDDGWLMPATPRDLRAEMIERVFGVTVEQLAAMAEERDLADARERAADPRSARA